MPDIREVPETIRTACERLMRAYLIDGTPAAADVEQMTASIASIYAEYVALQALEQLTRQVGQASDLAFAELMDNDVFAFLAPTMQQLLRFLRGRLAGQEPVLLLDEQNQFAAHHLALALLLLAAQALAATSSEPEQALAQVHQGLADDPAFTRAPAGDLSYSLPDNDNATTTGQLAREMLTETVPICATYVSDDEVLLVLALDARPDIRELFRLIATDVPAAGADTCTKWSGRPEVGTVRLDIE
ncbi:hypothetical protein [Nocardia sp. NPDC059239]|uniref:hypothetical protein n=1 Tax=Nocardia sp. NPDC059239 TaxID=3346785 RepID=UPI0036B57834